MKNVTEAKEFLSTLSRAEKAELLQWVVQDLGDAFPGIESTQGICGGEPRIVRTRIPVWLLEQAKRLGASDAELLRCYPTLRAEDLANAWAYARASRRNRETDSRKRGCLRMARFYANENFPLPVVEELRKLGHDVFTIQEAGKAEQEIPDDQVLAFASEDKRAVLTFNRKHFKKLNQEKIAHEVIIACTFDLDFPGLALRIHDAITLYRTLTGKFIRINRPAK